MGLEYKRAGNKKNRFGAGLGLRIIFIRIAVIIAVLQIPQAGRPDKLFSQSGTDFWDRGLMDRSQRILDYQFDRADRELSPDAWMEEARRGLVTARAVWAEMAPELLLNSGAQGDFDKWSEEEFERRFTRWLLERFFGAGIEAPATSVFRETSAAEKYLVYHTGPDGNILYDPGTGDPLIIRPGDDGYDFTEDLSAWRELTRGAAGRELQSYRTGIRENYPELLMYISPEREDEFFKKLFLAEDRAVQSLNHEFDAILAREERYFTAQRLGDVWSLRKKSEDQSADAIGLRLIGEASQVCANGIAAIEAKIEAARADDGDLTLAGAQWLEEYREQFSRGLQAWESAEERFLIRRLEWEYSSEKTYYEGLEAWNSAFARFEDERRKWEEKARILFLEGEQFFAQASETLEKAIAAAKAEYEIESRVRIGAASDKVGALANMYVLSATAAGEAKKNIDFWAYRYGETVSDASVPQGIYDLESWAEKEILRVEGADTSLEIFILEELKSWAALYRSYAEKAEKGLEDLMIELYSVSGFDSYETELLRAEGELDYWLHRTAMAEAVAAYAAALDAGRITAAESAEVWERARAAYNEAVLLYADAEDSLKAGGSDISAARESLVMTAEKMKAADAVLEMLRQNYQMLSALMGSRGSILIPEELAFMNKELSVVQELLGNYDETSAWGRYLACARELEKQQYDDLRASIISQLIAGDGDDFPSLASLARKENEFHGNEGLLNFTEALLKGEIISEEQYDLLISLIDEGSQLWAENQLDLRLAAISLFTEETGFYSWYYSVYEKLKTGMPDTAIPGIGMTGMETQLFLDWEAARLELFIARAELELEVLIHPESSETDNIVSILEYLYTGDETKRLEDRALLEEILELLSDLKEDKIKMINSGGLNNLLIEFSLANEKLLPFFAGYSMINPNYGNEIYGIFLSEYIRNEEFSGALYNTYKGLATLTPNADLENIELAFTQLCRLWEILGVEAGDSIIPNTETLILALKELEDDFASGIPPLLFIMDEIFNPLPSYLALSFNQWKESLLQYCALQTDEALALAERHTNVLNKALVLLKSEREDEADYLSVAARYLSDPLIEWDGVFFNPDVTLNSDDYEASLAELQSLYLREKLAKDEISRLVPLMELSKKDSEALENELDTASAAIDEAEETCRFLATAYMEAAENFRRAGEAYDVLYETTEKAFKNLEQARRAFEIQDAVRIWAETAYLDSGKPSDELNYCGERASFALAALEILKGINRTENSASEYKDAYSRFEDSFSLYTLSLQAQYELERIIGAERRINESDYWNYQEQLSLLGKSISLENDYISPLDKDLWGIKDMITVENGILVFAKDDENIISGCDEERTQKLIEYFALNTALEGETFQVSSFELALRELAETFSGLSLKQYMNLSLARDYLVKQILGSNPDLGGTDRWLKNADAMREGSLAYMTIGSDGKAKVYERVHFFEAYASDMQMAAWNSLDEKTKKDLEFYTILTLLDGGGKNAGYFSRVSELKEYDYALQYIDSSVRTVAAKTRRPFIGWIYRSDLDKLLITFINIHASLMNLNNMVKTGLNDLEFTFQSIDETLIDYKESSERLGTIKNGSSGIVSWEDIENAFSIADGSDIDLGPLKNVWDALGWETVSGIKDIPGALSLISKICENEKEESYGYLAQVWKSGEKERETNEAAYLELYHAWLDGNVDLLDLKAAAASCFGAKIPPEMEHLENIGAVILKNLSQFAERGLDGTAEQSMLVNEYVLLISDSWKNKYSAELAVRENEWDLQRMEIGEKLSQWRKSAAAILEQGRTAWKDGDAKLREACNVWIKTFAEEYGRISDQWTAAYLEGLYEKETWAASTLEAASAASSSAVLALIGSGAEAGARAMDTRDPLGFMNLPDMREGEKIISDLLLKSGTGYLASAFGSIQDSRESLATVVRTGIGGNSGGISVWNSGALMSEASALAKAVREDFETRESQKMAYMVMNTAREAYKMLEANVRLANDEFRSEMDETFIMGGLWSRSGTGYIKDVIVHSTFFTTVITEAASLDGYRNFILPQTQLSGYLYDDLPQNLNAFQAESLIDSIYLEINGLVKKTFDDEGDFQLHLGSQPSIKAPDDIDLDKGRAGVFDDFGEGELGRLLTEFYFWMVKEQLGIAMMDVAPWDKPMWDSRGSSVGAPSLRTVANIAAQTVAVVAGIVAAPFSGGSSILGSIAICVAINTTDDLTFAALDIAGGYKSWREAGFEYGKAVVTNTITAAAGSVFSAAGGVLSNGISAGVQTFTSGSINNVINSITYSDANGFGFSTDSFKEGIKQNAIGMLSAGAGTIASGLMNASLTGFFGDLLKDGNKLSNLTGGLVSQGVNYAFGNDFTLNIFNLGLVTGLFTDKEINAGLMELHLGRDGVNFQFGNGGADLSAGTLWSALKGTEAFLVNLELLLSDKEATSKYAKELRALYSLDATTREEYRNVLAGTTMYVDWGLDFSKSFYDEFTGTKTVFLGQDALEDGSVLGLAVVLAHEAYRDGKYNGIEGQIVERNNAVTGHIAMTLALMNTYGEDSVNSSMADEAKSITDALRNNDFMTAAAIFEMYDSSADFWKLLRNGSLLNDNSGWLTYENGAPVINADGKQIGASGIETGLLNILYGGTSGLSYGSFSDEQVQHAQALMILAGMNYTDGVDFDMRSRMWGGNTVGTALNMDAVMALTGNTIASIVFAKYFDSSVDSTIAHILGKDIGIVTQKTVPITAMDRYNDLVLSKMIFYGTAGSIVDYSLGYYISGDFGEAYEGHYAFYNYKHYGFDLSREGGSANDLLSAGISGIISNTDWNYAANGHSIQIEYGYQFEDSFIGSGIYGEYLHLKEETQYSNGTFVQALDQIGQISGTPNYTPHLHYDILTQNNNYSITTLAMLLGNNAQASSFTSANGVNTVYNPLSYYNSFLGLSLYTKNEYLAKKYR